MVQNVVIMNTNSCDQFTVMGSIEKLTFIRCLYTQKDRLDFNVYSVPRVHKNERLE